MVSNPLDLPLFICFPSFPKVPLLNFVYSQASYYSNSMDFIYVLMGPYNSFNFYGCIQLLKFVTFIKISLKLLISTHKFFRRLSAVDSFRKCCILSINFFIITTARTLIPVCLRWTKNYHKSSIKPPSVLSPPIEAQSSHKPPSHGSSFLNVFLGHGKYS